MKGKERERERVCVCVCMSETDREREIFSVNHIVLFVSKCESIGKIEIDYTYSSR